MSVMDPALVCIALPIGVLVMAAAVAIVCVIGGCLPPDGEK